MHKVTFHLLDIQSRDVLVEQDLPAPAAYGSPATYRRDDEEHKEKKPLYRK